MNEEQAFISIKDKIFEKKKLDVNQYKENYLKRRLAVRMRSLQILTYSGYLSLILGNEAEYDLLLDKLTINVTEFFRDTEVFNELEQAILPEIMRAPGRSGPLKVWSAGCSTGEEPYSIAMVIEETAERLGVLNPEYEIYATDLDPAALQKAFIGSFEGRTLNNVAAARKKRFFSQAGGTFLVSERLKAHIKFIRLNLMEKYKENFFEIVVCRNVIIYFTRELQKTVLTHYYDSLKPDGILFLGKTETMLQDLRDRFRCINIKERIFKKI
jgi:chemotaxis protein methyltransferase CheR